MCWLPDTEKFTLLRLPFPFIEGETEAQGGQVRFNFPKSYCKKSKLGLGSQFLAPARVPAESWPQQEMAGRGGPEVAWLPLPALAGAHHPSRSSRCPLCLLAPSLSDHQAPLSFLLTTHSSSTATTARRGLSLKCCSWFCSHGERFVLLLGSA